MRHNSVDNGFSNRQNLRADRALLCSTAQTRIGIEIMKKTSSLKSLKSRDKNNKVVRRRDGQGKMRLYVINKENPRMKAKQ